MFSAANERERTDFLGGKLSLKKKKFYLSFFFFLRFYCNL